MRSYVVGATTLPFHPNSRACVISREVNSIFSRELSRDPSRSASVVRRRRRRRRRRREGGGGPVAAFAAANGAVPVAPDGV